jgi:hypothetical protein
VEHVSFMKNNIKKCIAWKRSIWEIWITSNENECFFMFYLFSVTVTKRGIIALIFHFAQSILLLTNATYVNPEHLYVLFVCLMVFNATFNNISVISRRSALLVETTDLSQVADKLYHIMLYTSPWSRFELTTSVVICTDCIGSSKSNYHTITATTAPVHLYILM